jgi:hypothetical protein
MTSTNSLDAHTIALPAGDLASRRSAAKLRTQILSIWDQSSRITISCSGVDSIAASFADELFGMLAHEKGYQTTVDKIKLSNATPLVLKSIASAIRQRCREFNAHRYDKTGNPI